MCVCGGGGGGGGGGRGGGGESRDFCFDMAMLLANLGFFQGKFLFQIVLLLLSYLPIPVYIFSIQTTL